MTASAVLKTSRLVGGCIYIDATNMVSRLASGIGIGSSQWRTQEFFSGGVQQIQLRTEDREDGDLGAVAP